MTFFPACDRPPGEPPTFNLLVSCSRRTARRATAEVFHVLRRFGDEQALVERTAVHGILGVQTVLDARTVIARLRAEFAQDPDLLQVTLKWVPVDLWTRGDLAAMRDGIERLRDGIQAGETWRMTVEKHRYTLHHRVEIIAALAEPVPHRVDLTHPDWIVRIDIIGDWAALALLRPADVFSLVTAGRPAVGEEPTHP
jgi:tRNA(Ser,Leu) C12 N-acetylase TAN1